MSPPRRYVDSSSEDDDLFVINGTNSRTSKLEQGARKMQNEERQQQNHTKKREGWLNTNINAAGTSANQPIASSTPNPQQTKRARKSAQPKTANTSPGSLDMSTNCHGTLDLHLSLALLQDTNGSGSISLSQKLTKSPRKYGLGRGTPSKRLSKNSPLRYFRQRPLTSYFDNSGVRRSLFNTTLKDSEHKAEPSKNGEKDALRGGNDKKRNSSDSTNNTSHEETSSTATSMQQRLAPASSSEMEQISESASQAATDRALDEATLCLSGDLYTDMLVRVLAPVLRHAHTAPLLSGEEWQMLVAFLLLPPPSRTALTRLLARRSVWHRLDAFERYGSVEQLEERFAAAAKDGFVTLDYSSESASLLLPLLKLPELRSLCSKFNIAAASKPKPQLINNLLRLQSQQRSVTGKYIPLVGHIARALGPCVKASESLRSLLSRLFILVSLGCASMAEDRELPSTVFRLTNVESARVIYPTCEVIRSTAIFSTREHLLRYETALELQNESIKAIEKKDWNTAIDIITVVENNFNELLMDSNTSAHVQQLPSFLRQFTPGHVYARCLQYGADAHKKSGKEHLRSSAQLLELILSQKTYRTERRGKCFVALALLLHRHVRDPQAAAEVVIRAMNEPVPECCTAAEQLSLIRRAVMLAECRSRVLSTDVRRRLRLAILSPQPVMKVPEIVVKARQLEGRPGYKCIYIRDDHASNERHFSSVEEIAIAHYRTEGYTEGLHCEGSVVISLFALLFWDILYETPVPDAFLTPYQTAPLDLGDGNFYNNRRDSVDHRLADIRTWSDIHLQRFVGERYEEHHNKLCLVSWNNFCNVNNLTGLVRCMGGNLLSCVCERLAKNFHCCRRGFPDLVLWKPASGKCKLVEVKGPNDRLSPDQEIWLDFLVGASADVEICHIQTTGSKKPRRKAIDKVTSSSSADEAV